MRRGSGDSIPMHTLVLRQSERPLGRGQTERLYGQYEAWIYNTERSIAQPRVQPEQSVAQLFTLHGTQRALAFKKAWEAQQREKAPLHELLVAQSRLVDFQCLV